MALAVGTNKGQTGFPETCPVALQGSTGAYHAEAPALIDVDGGCGVAVVHSGGLFSTSIVGTAGASGSGTAGCLKATQGRIAKAIVTAAGTAATLIYDNALGNNTGAVIGYIPANPTVGTVYTFDMAANNGISVPAVASTSTFTLGWS